jgi:hypothetical protein
MSNSKHNFYSVNPIQPNLPTFIERPGKKFIEYGDDNLYPQFVASLFYKSAINRTCIQSKLDAVIGQGLRTTEADQQYVLNRANPLESWNDVFEKVALDYITFGGMAVNVIWNQEGTNIAEIYHVDFTKVRSGFHNPNTDKVEDYYYSSNWSEYRKELFKPRSYHAFDPQKADEFPSQIWYYFDYEPGNLWYPLPSYAGSLNDIQIDIETSKFHISNLANSLNPSLFIGLNNGIPEPEEREEIYDELMMAYRGSENAGKAFIAFSQDKEHAPDIIPIPSANDNYYVNLESRITTRILTGHRITSPLLLGLYHEGGGGLGSNKDEIMVSYQHFISTVVKPIQKSMLRVFDTLFSYYGYSSALFIEPNKLFEAEEVTIADEETKKEVDTSSIPNN